MRDVLVCAFKSLSRKWSRTLLTVSGITVGVAMVAIISMIASLGRAAVNAELDSLGVSGLSVSTAGDGTMLSARDLETIRGLSAVETAMPLLVEFSGSTLRDNTDKSLICGCLLYTSPCCPKTTPCACLSCPAAGSCVTWALREGKSVLFWTGSACWRWRRTRPLTPPGVSGRYIC